MNDPNRSCETQKWVGLYKAFCTRSVHSSIVQVDFMISLSFKGKKKFMAANPYQNNIFTIYSPELGFLVYLFVPSLNY